VAHDLNNLFGVIMGQAELALRHAEGEATRLRLTRISEATDRAATLVKQLLTFSRREVVQLTTVFVNHAIGETMKMLERIVGEHIAVDVRLGTDVWPIRADPAQFEQVVMNLVINAR